MKDAGGRGADLDGIVHAAADGTSVVVDKAAVAAAAATAAHSVVGGVMMMMMITADAGGVVIVNPRRCRRRRGCGGGCCGGRGRRRSASADAAESPDAGCGRRRLRRGVVEGRSAAVEDDAGIDAGCQRRHRRAFEDGVVVGKAEAEICESGESQKFEINVSDTDDCRISNTHFTVLDCRI